ncbi:MAG: hypothetical protein ABW352_24755 [Polyangiales bacterium]
MTFLRISFLLSLLLAFSACGGNETGNADSPSTADENDDTDGTDEDGEPTGNTRDASVKKDASSGSTNPPKDAGNTSTPKDSGVTTPKDAGTTPPVADAGQGIDAGNKDAGGGIMLPDLGTLFPTNDAGSTPPKTDAGSGGMGAPGAKDGPCKDLMLFCFDPFDMFIFNPELCFSCNGGKGCQGCAIPYAY